MPTAGWAAIFLSLPIPVVFQLTVARTSIFSSPQTRQGARRPGFKHGRESSTLETPKVTLRRGLKKVCGKCKERLFRGKPHWACSGPSWHIREGSFPPIPPAQSSLGKSLVGAMPSFRWSGSPASLTHILTT